MAVVVALAEVIIRSIVDPVLVTSTLANCEAACASTIPYTVPNEAVSLYVTKISNDVLLTPLIRLTIYLPVLNPDLANVATVVPPVPTEAVKVCSSA